MAYLRVRLSDEWEPGERPRGIDVTTRDGQVVSYVPERTCHPTHMRERWECDVCGCVICPGFMPEFRGVGALNYCPNCGAKIVKEEA